MSTTAATSKTAQPASSLATSRKFKAFAVTFSISGPVVYCVIQYLNYPLFTYWPAVHRLVWGFGAPSADDGPNMLWYGWSVTTILIACALGVIATIIPEQTIRKIPLWLVWLLPILAIPYVVYSLMPWWRLAARQ
ncbi:MAG: hypothetical protein WBQ24_01780 [Xanthobacteraceae bacterium]|jgi:hypothetical protein